jgi:hypothetical protein
MDSNRFDTLTRSLTVRRSRRLAARLLGGVGFALGLGNGLRAEPARGRRRPKAKPLRFNDFGCVPVGQPCRGNDANCCSGICEGNRPKKGKRDRSRCVAHDASNCPSGATPFGCGGTDLFCATTAGQDGVCATTTGDASYCADIDFSIVFTDCTRDQECQARSGNPTAACIRCGTLPVRRACAFAV